MPGTERYLCPCCGFFTLKEEPPGTYRICPVCYWEDDFLQFEDPSRRGGANGISLEEARRNFRAFGWAKEHCKEYVRAPHKDEYPPEPTTPTDAMR